MVNNCENMVKHGEQMWKYGETWWTYGEHMVKIHEIPPCSQTLNGFSQIHQVSAPGRREWDTSQEWSFFYSPAVNGIQNSDYVIYLGKL